MLSAIIRGLLPLLLVLMPLAARAESRTPLALYVSNDCRSAYSETGDGSAYMGCAQAMFDQADTALNAAYQEAIAGQPESAPTLKMAQRLWIRFRDADCDRTAAQARGDGNADVAFCKAYHTMQRTRDLSPSEEDVLAADPCWSAYEGNDGAYAACLDRTYEQSDLQLNQTYSALRFEGPAAQENRALMRQAQKAWIAFRDADCKRYTAPGNRSDPAEVFCRIDHTNKRTAELRTF